MHIVEINLFVDVGVGMWIGTCHCQPPMSPKEYGETIDFAGSQLRELCHRQGLRLSQVEETGLHIIRVETVEAADLPSRLDEMPVRLPGHRRATHVDWVYEVRRMEGPTNGH